MRKIIIFIFFLAIPAMLLLQVGSNDESVKQNRRHAEKSRDTHITSLQSQQVLFQPGQGRLSLNYI